jgi:DNA-directed RNA polymerase specialized sigma24 family protein
MDREARFRALFESAYPALHRYARNRGFSRPDADDLVASTFEVAWRRMEDVPRDDPLPWLIAVTHNLVRNKVRADWRREAHVARLPFAAPDAGSPETSCVDIERLCHALGRLDEDEPRAAPTHRLGRPQSDAGGRRSRVQRDRREIATASRPQAARSDVRHRVLGATTGGDGTDTRRGLAPETRHGGAR